MRYKPVFHHPFHILGPIMFFFSPRHLGSIERIMSDHGKPDLDPEANIPHAPGARCPPTVLADPWNSPRIEKGPRQSRGMSLNSRLNSTKLWLKHAIGCLTPSSHPLEIATG